VAESDTRARLIEVLAAELEIRHGTVQTWGAHIADVVLALPEIATCVEDYELAYRRGYENGVRHERADASAMVALVNEARDDGD
jgi:hypothetical protein